MKKYKLACTTYTNAKVEVFLWTHNIIVFLQIEQKLKEKNLNRLVWWKIAIN